MALPTPQALPGRGELALNWLQHYLYLLLKSWSEEQGSLIMIVSVTLY